MSLFIKAKTIAALGLANVARVGAYRLGLKTGLGAVRRVTSAPASGPFFAGAPTIRNLPASTAWISEATYFGYHRFPLADGPPDWFLNPLTGRRIARPERPWWNIPDFDPATGDIKVIWEPSRFDWVLAFAERIAAGDAGADERLERWLADWCANNPPYPYQGPNWKCGQETSIRVMHLAMAAIILGKVADPTPGIRQLLRMHLRRIEPTIGYAIGQDNNHGTSEAAALFIGGTWLAAAGEGDATRWSDLGRRLLENRIQRLVAEDGSFSQQSLTYHRVLLDTLSMAEAWRRHLALPDFTASLRMRAAAATRWLFALVNAQSGDGPNLGANDGARLLPLTDTGYRDFRPSVETAMVFFCGKRAYRGEGASILPLRWLGVPLPEAVELAPASRLFDDGGYAVLRNDDALVLLRYPRFRFRPAQADALHVDLWVGGQNLLRDAGTYSYNTDTATLDAFSGTAGHNTVQFDRRDQMPRLGRFLFGAWLAAEGVAFDPGARIAQAGYTDWRGASHHRHVQLDQERLVVRDKIAGRFSSAVLRWRLAPGDWKLDGLSLSNGASQLQISADMPVKRVSLVEGQESLHYLERHAIPVLEIEVDQPGMITSEFSWS